MDAEAAYQETLQKMCNVRDNRKLFPAQDWIADYEIKTFMEILQCAQVGCYFDSFVDDMEKEGCTGYRDLNAFQRKYSERSSEKCLRARLIS